MHVYKYLLICNTLIAYQKPISNLNVRKFYHLQVMAPYSLGEKLHRYVLILCLYSAIQYRVDARDSSQDFIAGNLLGT